MPSAPAARVRPLLVTEDPRLLDDLLRLAAAADVELSVAAAPGDVRAQWAAAPLVLVGADLAPRLIADELPRRGEVLLVATDDSRPEVWRQAVALGARDVVALPRGEPLLVDRLADAAEPRSRCGAVIGVVGGRGGAGASVLSAALALAAARRDRSATLVDLDPLGSGGDLLLGWENAAGSRWGELVRTRGRLSGAALRAALPAHDGLAVLTWSRGPAEPVPAAAVRSVLAAAVRGSRLVVADLPRRLDPAAAEAATLADRVLLVVPADVRSVVAAARVAHKLRGYTGRLAVVVRGPAPGGLAAEEVADTLGAPLAGRLPADSDLDRAIDQGRLPARTARGPLAAFCESLLDALPARTEAGDG
ncbi:septum site-determining protein Ssd [Allonocardiopsis opalescens]|uniref:Secretion/DNA translocation related CpaE-like protein n=1 Tax=Allonocardiopsis opalescens TaxID=1144618 RepID=A0A2T0Q6M1_9ACTN|nr:septum site-determining protein Ssd [Allonocardiopsis opalescens]PRX99476.1 secretion/DNA translocation related CpaE-like protein [Allonocardiopsis opalescens]